MEDQKIELKLDPRDEKLIELARENGELSVRVYVTQNDNDEMSRKLGAVDTKIKYLEGELKRVTKECDDQKVYAIKWFNSYQRLHKRVNKSVKKTVKAK